MEITQQAKYIDRFLNALYEAEFPISLAWGIEMKQLPSKENKEKFKTLEYIIEELDLVELVRGRDNSTLGGQCEYRISGKGREMIEQKQSSIELLLSRKIKKENFVNYLREQKVDVKKEMKNQVINNNGNLIINENSRIKNQSIESPNKANESIWTKANVIIALIVGLITVIGIIWGIMA